MGGPSAAVLPQGSGGSIVASATPVAGDQQVETTSPANAVTSSERVRIEPARASSAATDVLSSPTEEHTPAVDDEAGDEVAHDEAAPARPRVGSHCQVGLLPEHGDLHDRTRLHSAAAGREGSTAVSTQHDWTTVS